MPHLYLLICLTTFGIPLEAPATASDHQTAPVKAYRVIFNSDGHAVFKDAHGNLDQWISNLFSPLEESDVDALFWCDGAGGNTANYDSQVLERNGFRSGKTDPVLQKLIEQGNDPPAVVVREAKKRKLDVFFSFRINDIHDAFLPEERPTFKVEHPEWLIGKQKYGTVTSYETALNFAVDAVRDLKFRVVEEIFSKYDFDGLEIDFLRSAPYFFPGTEHNNAPLLTKLLKRIRKHLNKRSKERGKPIRLAVRVDETLAGCRNDGFEVAKWIDQKLIDYLILGSGVIDIEIAEFQNLAHSRGILVYPCLYGWPSRYSPIPQSLAAGTALTYWNQGADGIYLFNWFPHSDNNSEQTGDWMTSMLSQIGNPVQLRNKQDQLMFAVDRGRPSGEYPNNCLHCVLPQELVLDQYLSLRLRVGERFDAQARPAALKLQIQIDNLHPDDQISVSLANEPLNTWRPVGKDRLETDILASQIKKGDNFLRITLTKCSDSSGQPRIARAVELHVSQKN